MLCKDDFIHATKIYITGWFLTGLFAISSPYATTALAADLPDSRIANQSPELYQTAAKIDVKLGLLSNKKADIILQIPARQAYGFPGVAETSDQKAITDSVVDKLKQNMVNIVSVEPSLECKYYINHVDKFAIYKEVYEQNTVEEKRRITVEYPALEVELMLNCTKDLRNQTLNVDFSQNFKGINKIFVNLNGSQKRKFLIDHPSGSLTF